MTVSKHSLGPRSKLPGGLVIFVEYIDKMFLLGNSKSYIFLRWLCRGISTKLETSGDKGYGGGSGFVLRLLVWLRRSVVGCPY